MDNVPDSLPSVQAMLPDPRTNSQGMPHAVSRPFSGRRWNAARDRSVGLRRLRGQGFWYALSSPDLEGLRRAAATTVVDIFKRATQFLPKHHVGFDLASTMLLKCHLEDHDGLKCGCM